MKGSNANFRTSTFTVTTSASLILKFWISDSEFLSLYLYSLRFHKITDGSVNSTRKVTKSKFAEVNWRCCSLLRLRAASFPSKLLTLLRWTRYVRYSNIWQKIRATKTILVFKFTSISNFTFEGTLYSSKSEKIMQYTTIAPTVMIAFRRVTNVRCLCGNEMARYWQNVKARRIWKDAFIVMKDT